MKKAIKLGLTLLVPLFLSGCIQFDTVIKVKPDGSGSIEETFLIRKEFLQQMKTIAEGMSSQGNALKDEKKEGGIQQAPEAGSKSQAPDFFDEAKLKERANELGEGVTYVSGSKIVNQDYEGYRVTYAFKDINKIRMKQDLKEKIPSSPGQAETNPENKQENITFTLKKGNPAELVIKLPADQSPAKTEAHVQDKGPTPVNEQMPEELKAFMTNMFKGMKMALSVEAVGTVLETNAMYKDGSTVTLLELDFGKLIEKPEQFQKMNQFRPETLEDMRKLMRDFPGIKVELNNEVKIKFR